MENRDIEIKGTIINDSGKDLDTIVDRLTDCIEELGLSWFCVCDYIKEEESVE